MTVTEYRQEAKRIIELIKKDFVLPDGRLALRRQKGVLTQLDMFADLGDVIPFFLYFQESEFIDRQIELFQKNLHKGIYVSEVPTKGFFYFSKSYDYTDLILGLLDYYNYQPTETKLRLLLNQIETVIKLFNYTGNFRSFYSPTIKMTIPVKDFRDGMMIELFVELYQVLKDKRYLKVAENIYQHIVKNDFFRSNHLFPTYSVPIGIDRVLKFAGIDIFDQAEIMKSNTNTLYGMLALYLVDKNPTILDNIYRTISAIHYKAMTFNNGVIKTWNVKHPTNRAFMVANSFMEFLCDFYFYNRRPADLYLAEQIAHYWLQLQAPTGLFPEFSDGRETFVDSETDFIISLYKLYELTSNEKYRQAADKCLAGLLEYHGQKDYPLKIDVIDGHITVDEQKTKFLALALKPLILMIELSQGKTIYQDKALFSLLRDR